jgi:prolyl oligopeptidase
MRFIQLLVSVFISCLMGCVFFGTAAKQEPSMTDDSASIDAEHDAFMWLESVEGEKPLKWVRERNAESLAVFEADPLYPTFIGQAEGILNATDRIPYGRQRGQLIYNFWQDENNVRGLWRRTSIDNYRRDDIAWETVIDVDALAKTEEENWVYKGVFCLAPAYERCMVKLSRGGTDASVYREFDLVTKAFVTEGFIVPEAKSSVAWIDKDTLLVATAWDEKDSTTESGYPRIVKKWRRGKSLNQAEFVMEGAREDVGVWPWVMHTPTEVLVGVVRSKTFFTAEYHLLKSKDKLVQIPLQESAEVQGYYEGQLIFTLREDWQLAGLDFKMGSLLAFDLKKFQVEQTLPSIQTLAVAGPRTSITGVYETPSGMLVSLLDNVRGKVIKFEREEDTGAWASTPVSLPQNGSLSVSSSGLFEDRVMINYEDHTTPDRLYEYDPKTGELQVLKTLPERFDSSELVVHQYEASSADGELVPYFVVHHKNIPLNGNSPTLLYGYGGFEISLTPRYLTLSGKLWLERGGVYAVANIRGGGEFGPRWHKAALRENRQRAYDDFIAVSEDLIERQITQPKKLGIMGGSNGGLLVGVALTQRPDLYGAVVCQVPLLDMLRYTKLLAGASWAAEYGDPDDPIMRKAISRYSPYQNVFKDRSYPKAFFMTSTKDDRVHPGHARKMVAKLIDQGHPVHYFENIEGGHSAAANLKQRAKQYALQYVYLARQLGLK